MTIHYFIFVFSNGFSYQNLGDYSVAGRDFQQIVEEFTGQGRRTFPPSSALAGLPAVFPQSILGGRDK